MHLACTLILDCILLGIEVNAPLEEQFQLGDEWMRTCFHHDEVTFLHGLQFISRHKGAFRHL